MHKTTKGKRVKCIFPGLLVILLFICFVNLSAQQPANPYALIDQKARHIPSAFTVSTEKMSAFINDHGYTDDEKIRTIYTWMATHIEYDIHRFYSTNSGSSREEKIIQILLTRKGICEDYTALFQDLCLKTGVKCYMIEGYTKQFGAIDQIPHSWCAALTEKGWNMYDPTWGSGYISQGKFVKAFSEEYFNVSPDIFIRTCIPFDPIWQFLYYPVNGEEFKSGTLDKTKQRDYFNYPDSICLYENQDLVTRNKAVILRIEKYQVKNKAVREQLKFLREEMETEKQNRAVRQYNAAVSDYNSGIASLNAFIHYRNAQFIPQQPEPEIREMISRAIELLKSSLEKLKKIGDADPRTAEGIHSLQEICLEALHQSQQQQQWLEVFLKQVE